MKQQFSIIDVFCGIGGMSKGFLDAGFQVNQAIDLDKEKVSIYNSNFALESVPMHLENSIITGIKVA